MAIEKLDIEKFLSLAKGNLLLDARSPGEYNHAHIPATYNLPLFTDDERKVVGTAYKQQSRKEAIRIGLDFFGLKMRKMVEEVDSLMSKDTSDNAARGTIFIHCWRGGMRSAAVAWLLDMYGYKVYTLNGGYKAFRNWVLQQFEKEYSFKILGGYTGSGKTIVLHELKHTDPVIDLEGLAHHKGSAFGALGEKPQPSQEMFENKLAISLFSQTNYPIWLEDESQRIGQMLIPHPLWRTMRASPVYFLDIPFEERLNYIVSLYGVHEKEKLVNAIMRIQKRLGGLETKTAINALLENNTKECFYILLRYYDKLYKKGLYSRENIDSLLNIIPCESVDVKTNINKLLLQKV